PGPLVPPAVRFLRDGGGGRLEIPQRRPFRPQVDAGGAYGAGQSVAEVAFVRVEEADGAPAHPPASSPLVHPGSRELWKEGVCRSSESEKGFFTRAGVAGENLDGVAAPGGVQDGRGQPARWRRVGHGAGSGWAGPIEEVLQEDRKGD